MQAYFARFLCLNNDQFDKFGFSEEGRILLYDIIVPKLEKWFDVNEPFRECMKYFPAELKDQKIRDTMDYGKVRNLYARFNSGAAATNRRLMEKSKIMAAILDGGHTIDDGTAGEIGRYCAKKYGPIIALRTDMRLGENIGSSINLQIESDIIRSKGKLCISIEEWYNELKKRK